MEKKIVEGTTDSKLWDVIKGQKCRVIDTEFYNGETWYMLIDEETGKRFNSPTVFWKEI